MTANWANQTIWTGDMVLNPFCGRATACIAAEQIGRQWVGIDISFP